MADSRFSGPRVENAAPTTRRCHFTTVPVCHGARGMGAGSGPGADATAGHAPGNRGPERHPAPARTV